MINRIVPFVRECTKNTERKTIARKGRRVYAGEIISNVMREFYNSAAISKYPTFNWENKITNRASAKNTIVLPIAVWTTCWSYTRTDPYRSPSTPATEVTAPLAKVRKATTIAALRWLHPQHEVLLGSEISLIGVLDDAIDDCVLTEVSQSSSAGSNHIEYKVEH